MTLAIISILALALVWVVAKSGTKQGWLAEFVIVLAVAFLFLESHVYLSVCIFIFHCLSMFQIIRTENLLGKVRVVPSAKQKIQSLLFLVVIVFAISSELAKKEALILSPIGVFETKNLVAAASGEVLPYLLMLGLMSALMMYGLTAERRRR